jgi:hypothetical protein
VATGLCWILAGLLSGGPTSAPTTEAPLLPAYRPRLVFPLERPQFKALARAQEFLGGPPRFVDAAGDPASRILAALVDAADSEPTFTSELVEFTSSGGRWTRRALRRERDALFGAVRCLPDGGYLYAAVKRDRARGELTRALWKLAASDAEPKRLAEFERLIDYDLLNGERMYLFCEAGRRERFAMLYEADVAAGVMKSPYRAAARADEPLGAALAVVRHGAYVSAHGDVTLVPADGGRPQTVLAKDYLLVGATPSGALLVAWQRHADGRQVLTLLDPVKKTQTAVPAVTLRGRCLSACVLPDGLTFLLLIAIPDETGPFWTNSLWVVSGSGERVREAPLSRPCLGVHVLDRSSVGVLCYNGLWSVETAVLIADSPRA